MAEEAKQMISEDQLKNIQELTQKQNEVLLSLGSLEVQKINLNEMFKANALSLEEIKKELEKEHGQVQVDLKTGEITEIPKEDDKK
jgi:3-methyladenine DNA glycosylase AlkD